MRHSLKILILAAAYIANTMGAGAQESYLDRLAEQILSSNPELASMRHAANAEDYSMKAGNQLDAPEIEVEHLFGEAGVKNKTGITVSQSFWPGAYRARSKAADLSRRARQLSLQAAYRDKVQEAKLLMLDIIYCRARKDMLDSAYENVSQLLDFTVKAYDNGELTILDVNRLRLSRLSLRSQCSEARIAHQSLMSSLEALAGHRDVSSVWEALTDFPYEPILPEEAYSRAVEESNPAIAAARARAEAEAIARKGNAEAEAKKASLLAEAEGLERKAEAMQKLNSAGVIQMVIDKLPEMASAVAQPLTAIDKISIIDSGSGESGVSRMGSYVPSLLAKTMETVKETTGFDMLDAMKSNTIQAQTERNIKVEHCSQDSEN